MKQEEFIEIIKNHRKLIYKICQLYCADTHQREDLEQEILIQLWLSMDRYDGRVKLSTWMYKVALNTAIAFYRTDSKYQSRRLPLEGPVIAMAGESDNNDQDEKIALLHHLIHQLNVNDRAIILLYLDKAMQYEIAEIVGISASNVATKISKIKNKLKQQMHQHFK